VAARAIWKGVLKFGSAAVPVKVYSAVQDRDIHFHLLHDQDQVRLEQRMVNPVAGRSREGEKASVWVAPEHVIVTPLSMK